MANLRRELPPGFGQPQCPERQETGLGIEPSSKRFGLLNGFAVRGKPSLLYRP